MSSLIRYETDSGNTDKTDYTEFISQIDDIAGFSKHNLKASAGGRPIFGYSIGSNDKPVVFIDACIHNLHEWKSAHAAMEIMRVLADPNLWADEADIINKLKSKFRFYFIPVVSPDSYITGSRPNANGVALDLNFPYNWKPEGDGVNVGTGGTEPFSEPESQNIRDVITNNNVAIYVNTHTVGSNDRLMMTRRNVNPDVESALVAASIDTARTYSDYSKPYLITTLNPNSSSYNWAGTQDGALTDRILAGVLESASNLDLPKNKNVSVYSMFSFISKISEALFADDDDDDKRAGKVNRFFKDYHTFISKRG